jgi:hypothetical protein
MSIEQKKCKIQIGNNLFFASIKTQLPIQFIVVGHTIHCAQGLTLDHFEFESIGKMKHDLTYITLFQVHCKKHLYFPLSNKNFQVNFLIQEARGYTMCKVWDLCASNDHF